MVRDIVCNMEIDQNQAAAKSEYKGSMFYFCAEACKNIFDAEPVKYIKKLGWWKRFLIRLASANKEAYGSEPPKCCK